MTLRNARRRCPQTYPVRAFQKCRYQPKARRRETIEAAKPYILPPKELPPRPQVRYSPGVTQTHRRMGPRAQPGVCARLNEHNSRAAENIRRATPGVPPVNLLPAPAE